MELGYSLSQLAVTQLARHLLPSQTSKTRIACFPSLLTPIAQVRRGSDQSHGMRGSDRRGLLQCGPMRGRARVKLVPLVFVLLLDLRADCTGRQERHVRVSPSSLDSTASTQPVPLGTTTPVGLFGCGTIRCCGAKVVQGVRLDVCAERGTAGKFSPASCFGVRDDGAVAQGAVPSLASLVAIA